MGRRIRLLPILQVLKEVLRPPLLEEPHQRTPHRLHLRARDLGDPPIPIDIRPRDDLELEVTHHVGMHEHTRELAGGEDEFMDEVDGVVAIAA